MDEPQHDTSGGENDFGMDLLARARLLCQAANEIALPMLQSMSQLTDEVVARERNTKASRSRPASREEDDSDGNQQKPRERSKSVSRGKSREKGALAKMSKLPAVPAPTLPPLGHPPGTGKKPMMTIAKPLAKKKKEHMEEDATLPLPQINATGEWRKQRETEKIRQAQERAKARVLRKSNQAEQPDGDTTREISSESTDGVQNQIEVNRRRAQERVKLRKMEQAAVEVVKGSMKHEPQSQIASEDSVQRAEAFRHRTLQRLQAAKREAQAQEQTVPSTEQKPQNLNQVDNVDAEKERKRQEKQRRRETAERMKRHQELAEEQQRKEKELFEQGLNDFKTRKKEQDRVAKGLQSKQVQMDAPISFSEETMTASTTKSNDAEFDNTILGSDAAETSATSTEIDDEISLDGQSSVIQSSDKEELSIMVDTSSDLQPTATQPKSSGLTTGRQKRLPSWKQPPVPILPTEYYTLKAMVSPSDSYAEKFQFRTGKASPNPAPGPTLSPVPDTTNKERLAHANTVKDRPTSGWNVAGNDS